MTAIWKKIYADNYHKSLDHRSFYFKQVGVTSIRPPSPFPGPFPSEPGPLIPTTLPCLYPG